MPLINCEVSLTLTWSENSIITSLKKRTIGDTNNRDDSPTNEVFKITDYKLHVPVVTLSAQTDSKLLEQLKTRFKRTITWNKYRSQMSNQTVNNNLNLNYLIDPTFTNVHRLFVLSLKNEHGNDDEDESVTTSFKKYHNKIVMLAKSKLNSTETLMSQALIDFRHKS